MLFDVTITVQMYFIPKSTETEIESFTAVVSLLHRLLQLHVLHVPSWHVLHQLIMTSHHVHHNLFCGIHARKLFLEQSLGSCVKYNHLQ